MKTENEIRVCLDIGKKKHYVVIGLAQGGLLDSFAMEHTTKGIDNFFDKILQVKKNHDYPVAIAMEAFNGYARPIDQCVLDKGYRLLNVNNNKLAQFKKIFPGPEKSDPVDALKMFELFVLDDCLPLAKNILQEVQKTPDIHNHMKRLTRRRGALVQEKVVTTNRMQADIQSISPDLLAITGSADNLWFLSFLTAREDLTKLSRMTKSSLLKIPGVGKRFIEKIETWQKQANFAHDVAWVGEMIIQDAKRLLALKAEIIRIEKTLETLISHSTMAQRINTIPGFGAVTSTVLAGEIGTLERFDTESKLALYSGMAVLNNSSGEYMGTKRYMQVNQACKRALMAAVFVHINCSPEAKKYYDKKRAEGKKHNQAVRALGRHMIRVIWSMLKNDRDYKPRPGDAQTS